MTWLSSRFKSRMVFELMAHKGKVRNVNTRSRNVISSRSFSCIMQIFTNVTFINCSVIMMYPMVIVADYNYILKKIYGERNGRETIRVLSEIRGIAI
jgi:hypothetical protein